MINYITKIAGITLIIICTVGAIFVYGKLLLALCDLFGTFRIVLIVLNILALASVIALYL